MSIEKLQRQVAQLENSLTFLDKYFNKLDRTLEKITSLANDLNQIIAVHESRLNSSESMHSQLMELTGSIREHMDENKEGLHQRISTVNTVLNNRVRKLENWRWLVVGGFGVAVILIPILIKIIK